MQVMAMTLARTTCKPLQQIKAVSHKAYTLASTCLSKFFLSPDVHAPQKSAQQICVPTIEDIRGVLNDQTKSPQSRIDTAMRMADAMGQVDYRAGGFAYKAILGYKLDEDVPISHEVMNRIVTGAIPSLDAE
jgi:hypothetical protein